MNARRLRPPPSAAPAEVLMALRPPVEAVLTAALRRVGRRRPDVFERLGEAADAAFVLQPTDFPVAFRLTPVAGSGRVKVVRRGDSQPFAARISGPLATLVAMFDGSSDADSAFFSRRIKVEGDTRALVALHNTLEAAELTVADILGLPAALHPSANAAFARLRRSFLPAIQ